MKEEGDKVQSLGRGKNIDSSKEFSVPWVNPVEGWTPWLVEVLEVDTDVWFLYECVLGTVTQDFTKHLHLLDFVPLTSIHPSGPKVLRLVRLERYVADFGCVHRWSGVDWHIGETTGRTHSRQSSRHTVITTCR